MPRFASCPQSSRAPGRAVSISARSGGSAPARARASAAALAPWRWWRARMAARVSVRAGSWSTIRRFPVWGAWLTACPRQTDAGRNWPGGLGPAGSGWRPVVLSISAGGATAPGRSGVEGKAVVDHPQAGVHHLGVVALAAPGADFGEGGVEPQGRPVGAVGHHGFDHVGHRHDAGFEADILALEALGVAGAVEALVVLVGDIRHRPGEFHVGEDAVAGDRVILHQPVFDIGEAAGLGEDIGGHGDLADVVDHGAEAHALDAFVVKA